MKKLIFFSLLTLLLVGCKKENEIQEIALNDTTGAPIESATGQLVQIIDSTTYSVRELAQAITHSHVFEWADNFSSGITSVVTPVLSTLINARKPVMDALFATRVGLDKHYRSQYCIESYVFTFTTLSAAGKPIVLSGRITFPNNTVENITHTLDAYTLFSHQYVMGNDWVPSHSQSLMSARALYNEAVIEPDMQGYGATENEESVAFISANAGGRQMADCINAALTILKRRNVRLADNGYSTNWGSSLGATSALAFARYYDREASPDLRKAVRLRSSYISEGPLDMAGMIEFQDANPSYKTATVTFICALDALNDEQMMGHTCSDFLSKYMCTTMVEFRGKQYPYYYAESHKFPNYNDYKQKDSPDTLFVRYLNENLYNSDLHLKKESQTVQDLLTIMRQQAQYLDWQPTTELYFSHAIEDETLPYQLSRDVYEQILSQSGSGSNNMHWLDIPTKRSILAKNEAIGPHHGVAVEAMLYMVLAREPKDMYIFYK
ncbi:MAG: hypothetical protein IJR13_05540 [Bacteroidales bacterium]|nr:hypothetical protein [Bacteroidales bacterium]